MGLRATFRDLALPVIVPLLALVAVLAAAAATPGYETLKDRAEDLLLGLRRPAPPTCPSSSSISTAPRSRSSGRGRGAGIVSRR